MNKKKTKLEVALGLLLTVGLSNFAFASTTTSDTEHYLVIATGGKSGDKQDHFLMSNVEIGANQEFISDGTPNTSIQKLGKFKNPTGKGYDGGLSLIGKGFDISNANLNALEGKDYSGNVALIGKKAKLKSSDSDVNAKDKSVNSGILCANSTRSECEDETTSFFYEDKPNKARALEVGKGSTKGVDFSGANGLINDLAQQREWILGLESDVTWTMSDINQFDRGSMGNVTTSIDDLNSQTGGENADYVVIDLDLNANNSGYFHLNNVNWIIESLTGLTAIFRMADGNNYDFSNASIMLSDGTTNLDKLESGELGAIFYQDARMSTNKVFELSNVILGGIGLWDFTDFNPKGHKEKLMHKDSDPYDENGFGSVWNNKGEETNITMSNAQGCGQFISNTIDMSNNRWTRCSLAKTTVDVPEPSTLLLFALGLFGLRSRKKQCKV